MKVISLNINPKLQSKTYIAQQSKNINHNSFKKFAIGFFILIFIVAPLAAQIVNASTLVTFTTTADFTAGTTVTDANATEDEVTLGITNHFVQLAGGYYHSLGVKADGTLWVWGEDGVFGDSDTPVQVGSDTNWVKAAGTWGGDTNSIALKSDGTLWAWGSNTYGQLGQGNTTYLSSVTQIGTDTDWADFAEGGYHVLAVKTNGTLWSWGRNNNRQLGQGNTTELHVPTQVGVATNWSKVIGRGTHSLALKTDGTLWTWGKNDFGQLGLGDTTFRSVPTQVGTDTDWENIYGRSGGSTSAASKEDGSLWVWGNNDVGQLGLGDYDNRDVPTELESVVPWRTIALGDKFMTAIKDDGTLWNWGNTYNLTPLQVGTDTDWDVLGAGAEHNLVTKTNGTLWFWYQSDINQYSPTQVGMDEDWVMVSSGGIHTLAIKSDGTLWAWGWNGNGQLGLGTADFNSHLSPTQVGTDTDWQIINAGNQHSLAIKSDGTLWAWGWNEHGGLGQGDSVNLSEPTQVGTDTDWQTINAGYYDQSLAIKTNGTLWSWGWNGYGELGLGDAADHLSPTQVGTDTDWQTIDNYDRHTAAIKTDGTLWAWGNNEYGALGIGVADTDPHYSPIQIGTDTNWSKITVGDYYSLALKQNGTLWSWGWNGSGQLGLGDTTQRHIPTQVGTDTNWSRVASGSAYSMANKSDGTLWVWGNNCCGQLGLGDTTQRNSPNQVSTDTDWNSITGGGLSSMAIKDDGTLWAWGGNWNGQLGLGLVSSSPLEIDSSSYLSSGSISGLTINAGETVAWNTVSWLSESLPPDTIVKFRARTSNDGVTYSSWSDYFTQDTDSSTIGTGDLSSLADSQYLELELTLETTDSANTPTLTSFTVSYDPVSTGSGTSSGSSATPQTNAPVDPSNPDSSTCLGYSSTDSCITQQEYIPGTNLNPGNSSTSEQNNILQTFLRNLGLGSIGEDVKRLQTFLNQNNFILAIIGYGSPGQETTYYGPRSKASITKFQEAYRDQILTPLGLSQGTGYFGNNTRALINNLIK